MKAERRHELKTNTLAHQLERLPFTLREHGAKILGIAFVVLLLIVVVNYRIKSARENHNSAAETLGSSRALIRELQQRQERQSWGMPPADIAANVREGLDSLAGLTDHPSIAAEALVARGDLNLALANLTDLNSTTTQPLLQINEDKAELIQQAKDAYQQVVSQYPDQAISVVTARFGLAAIAEDHGDWDAASEQYQAIQSNVSAAKTFHDLAKLRQDGLAIAGQAALPGLSDLRQPILLAKPSTRPATLPIEESVMPEVAPAPTTQSATTQPAS